MSAANDGGLAFPGAVMNSDKTWTAEECGQGGMTLRDYFAAKAMQAAATNPTGADGFDFDQRAEWAYAQADAMLKARAA